MEKLLIFEKMALVLQDINAIGKNKKSQGGQSFAYRGIDDVLNALNPIFAKHGVFAVPEVLERTKDERINKNGTVLSFVILRVRYTFYASDGSSVFAIVDGEAMDSGDKATSKAMSIAMKYAFFQTFCIPIEDVEDPDSRDDENTQKQTVSSDDVKVRMINKLVADCGNIGEALKYCTNALGRQVTDFADITPQDINVIATFFKQTPPIKKETKDF